MPAVCHFFLSFESAGSLGGLSVHLEAKIFPYLQFVLRLLSCVFIINTVIPTILLVFTLCGSHWAALRPLRARRSGYIACVLVVVFIAPPEFYIYILPLLLLFYEIAAFALLFWGLYNGARSTKGPRARVWVDGGLSLGDLRRDKDAIDC